MKVLFVYTIQYPHSYQKPLASLAHIHFGISYISAVLKQHKHHVKLTVLSKAFGQRNWERLDRAIKDFKPGLVCFTSINAEYVFTARLAHYIKKNYPHIFLLIGGCHATLNPEEACRDDFDGICLGEGEYPTLELISQLQEGKQPSQIPNLWIKSKGEVEKNSLRPFLENLDNLPIPDRNIWNEWCKDAGRPAAAVLLGRGCPFECSYCFNHALKKITTGAYCRIRSAENIVEEVRSLHLRYTRCQEIYFEIETFGVNKKWAARLCNELILLNATLERPFSFGVNLRIVPKIDYTELLTLCKKSNFKYINIGLESGSERLRREVLNRNYENKDIINAVKTAQSLGLEVQLYNMIGLPTETLEDFKATVELNRICQPDRHSTAIFFLIREQNFTHSVLKKGLSPGILIQNLNVSSPF